MTPAPDSASSGVSGPAATPVESELRYQRLFEQSIDGVFVATAEGRYENVSDAGCRMFGRTRDEMLACSFTDVLALEEQQRLAGQISALLDGNVHVNQWRFVRKDGSFFLGELSGRRLPDGRFLGVVRDVTDRKHSEHLLREQAAVLESIAGGAPLSVSLQQICEVVPRVTQAVLVITVLDEDLAQVGVCVASQGAAGVAAARKHAARGANILGPCEAAIVQNEGVQCADIAADGRWSSEWRDSMLGCGLRASYSFPVLDSAARPVAVLSLAFPIPHQVSPAEKEVGAFWSRIVAIAIGHHRHERALRETEQRYQLVGEAANDAIWDWDLATNLVTWNNGAEKLFGYAPSQIDPDASWWLTHIHPDDRDRISHDIHSAIEGNAEIWSGEYRFLRADGTYAGVFDRGRIVRTAGRPTRMVGSMLDLTERRMAEAALREAENRFIFVRRTSGVGFWYCDLPFDVLQWDENVKEHFHLPPDASVTIDTFYERIHPADREPTRRAIARSIDEHSTYDVDYRTVDPATKVEKWIRAIGRTFYGPDGTPVRFDGVTIDVTGRKRTEEQLALAHEQLASHAKQLDALVDLRTTELKESLAELESFSYSMAHDLRGPLRRLQAFAAIVRDEYGHQLDEAGLKLIGRMSAAADRMQRLVTDVLTYSKVSRQELVLHPVVLEPLIKDIIEQYPQLKEARVHIEGQLPVVLGHPGALTQVISNLLTNAVKFMPPGRLPDVKVSACPEDPFVVLNFYDNGIGIAPEHHERIFGMFERLHHELKFEGTGIGLAIVRRAVHRMGGSVGVESSEGHGSRFWVKLRVVEKVTPPSSAR